MEAGVARLPRPTRREAFGTIGAGFVFQFVVKGAPGTQLGARLRFDAGGAVTLLTGKVELGQGSRTLLTQCVAEELGVAPGNVRVVMGDTALVPDDGGTYASLTTPLTVPVVRQAAAAARRMLETMTPAEAGTREIPVEVDLTPPAKWKTLGKPMANVNGRAIVTGALKYSTDVKVPGMLAGKVVRPVTVWGDGVFLLNAILDYLLMAGAAKLRGGGAEQGRLLCAAGFGGALAVMALYRQIPPLLRLAAMPAMAAVSPGRRVSTPSRKTPSSEP